MDTVQQKILEQINFNLQSISLYIEKLSREEIKLDSNQIYLIDYSSHEWLNIVEYQDIKKRLEEYNKESVNDIINNNFVEYCRKVYLQIEILLDKFIMQKYGNGKLEDSNYIKIKRLKDFFNLVRGGEENFRPYEDKEYKMITHVMDIRDIASHTNCNGKSLAERVESKGKFIEIKLQKINNNISIKEEIETIFSEFVLDKKWLRINYKNGEEYGYAFIKMYKLKDTYLEYHVIKHYLDRNFNIFKHRLGNKFELSPVKNTNELKIFFEQQDYQQIKHIMNWFIQEIGNHLN